MLSIKSSGIIDSYFNKYAIIDKELADIILASSMLLTKFKVIPCDNNLFELWHLNDWQSSYQKHVEDKARQAVERKVSNAKKEENLNIIKLVGKNLNKAEIDKIMSILNNL